MVRTRGRNTHDHQSSRTSKQRISLPKVTSLIIPFLIKCWNMSRVKPEYTYLCGCISFDIPAGGSFFGPTDRPWAPTTKSIFRPWLCPKCELKYRNHWWQLWKPLKGRKISNMIILGAGKRT